MKIAALSATAFILFGFGITIGPASAQQEFLMWEHDSKEWEVGNQSKSRNQIVMEFVRPSEKIDGWTELMTVQVISKPRSPEPIDELVPKMHQEISKRCPKMMWNVISREFAGETEEAGMVYEWSIKDCPPDADQHEIARVIYGRFNIFRLAYTTKTGELPPEKREKLIKNVSESRVVRK